MQWILRSLGNVDQEIEAWKLRHVRGYEGGSEGREGGGERE